MLQGTRFDATSSILAHLVASGNSAQTWLAPWLAALAHSMLFLREEGRDVRPVLLVVSSDDGWKSLLAPAANFYGIADAHLPPVRNPVLTEITLIDGSLDSSPTKTAPRVLKEVANLYGGDWAPGLDLRDRSKPQLFCLDRPIRPGEGRWMAIPKHSNVVAVGKVRDGHVRLVGGPFHGSAFDVLADPSLDSHYTIVEEHRWAAQFLGAVKGPEQGLGWTQLVHLLGEALDHCHGALLAVAARDRLAQCRETFGAGCWFAPPIDLFGATVDQATSHRLTSLLHNVLSMDGVVVLSDDGRLLGYRCIVSSVKGGNGVVGGARRTTFRTMGDSGLFEAVLMKSQNGGYAGWSRNGYDPTEA